MEVAEVARRRALIQRLFAWTTAHQDTYEASMMARKRALFGDLHGAILEIGPGAGYNLRYYPADARWVGVEPNPFMHPYLEKSIRELHRPAEHFYIDPGDPLGVRLPADDESVDAAVSTLVLCSVPYPEESLQEIWRVLKPGGRFAFIEHVAAPSGTRLRSFQDFFQPVWTLLADGCHPNRETWQAISQAGFGRVELEHFLSSGGLAGPHIAGMVVKGGA
jgi:SAM-dependent methyltransferase